MAFLLFNLKGLRSCVKHFWQVFISVLQKLGFWGSPLTSGFIFVHGLNWILLKKIDLGVRSIGKLFIFIFVVCLKKVLDLK